MMALTARHFVSESMEVLRPELCLYFATDPLNYYLRSLVRHTMYQIGSQGTLRAE